MTTLQLNQKLFGELAAIVGDEDKMQRAIHVLHIIATSPSRLNKKHLSARSKTEDMMNDEQWDRYFADKPARELPADTDTERFVNHAKGRVIKQVKPWL